MRAKFIYEKFLDETDPIRDLGIGEPALREIWKKYYNKVGNAKIDDNYKKYFSKKYPTNDVLLIGSFVMTILCILELLTEQKKKPEEAFKLGYKTAQEIWPLPDYFNKEEFKKAIINFCNKKLLLNVTHDMLNESFTEDSDPIEDMEIGMKRIRRLHLNDMRKIDTVQIVYNKYFKKYCSSYFNEFQHNIVLLIYLMLLIDVSQEVIPMYMGDINDYNEYFKHILENENYGTDNKRVIKKIIKILKDQYGINIEI